MSKTKRSEGVHSITYDTILCGGWLSGAHRCTAHSKQDIRCSCMIVNRSEKEQKWMSNSSLIAHATPINSHTMAVIFWLRYCKDHPTNYRRGPGAVCWVPCASEWQVAASWWWRLCVRLTCMMCGVGGAECGDWREVGGWCYNTETTPTTCDTINY